jgi:hypothetical protein
VYPRLVGGGVRTHLTVWSPVRDSTLVKSGDDV